MANPAPITKNLKPWKPGQSGNPKGRSVGSRNLSTIIQELLADEELADMLLPTKPRWWDILPEKNGAYAMVAMILAKACDGDIRAAEWIAKTGYGSNNALQPEPEREELPIYVIDLNPRTKEGMERRRPKQLTKSKV
jgi:hypothetical protein